MSCEKMETSECKNKSNVNINVKFSAKKIIKIVKGVKPFIKFMTKKHRTNAITPSTCNYDVVESVQNNLNESEVFNLHFKFLEISETDENIKNEELEKRLLQDVENNAEKCLGVQAIVDDDISLRPVAPGTYFAIPVRFVETCPGQFAWAPLTDVDICRREDESITNRQTAERQTAILAA